MIGKRFQDAGLRNVIIESGVIAGDLEGRSYNRTVRFHKLMFEALNRLTWMGFKSWNIIKRRGLLLMRFSKD